MRYKAKLESAVLVAQFRDHAREDHVDAKLAQQLLKHLNTVKGREVQAAIHGQERQQLLETSDQMTA